MKKYFIMVLLIISVLLSGCTKDNNEEYKHEKFMLGTTLDDGRLVNFSFDVPYKEKSLSDTLLSNEISIDDFIKKLDHVSTFKDGGSKLYKYNKITSEFGNDQFYVLVCNSLDDIHDIFVARYKESLSGLCSIKIDDLDGVSMTIKKGTLTKTKATVIITDTSDRENIYGESYKIEKYENDKWSELKSKHDMIFNDIGYMVDENNTLELDINWEYYYGKLKKGKYRIVKTTQESGEPTPHYITVEFDIK